MPIATIFVSSVQKELAEERREWRGESSLGSVHDRIMIAIENHPRSSLEIARMLGHHDPAEAGEPVPALPDGAAAGGGGAWVSGREARRRERRGEPGHAMVSRGSLVRIGMIVTLLGATRHVGAPDGAPSFIASILTGRRQDATEDAAARATSAELRQLLTRLRSSRSGETTAARTRLAELAKAQPEALRAAAKKRRAELDAAWRKAPEQKKLAEIGQALVRLEAARKDALAFIEDPARYPSSASAEGHDATAQAEVDRLVRAVWDILGDKEDPPEPKVKLSGAALAVVAELRELRALLEELKAGEDDLDSKLVAVWLLPPDAKELNVRNCAIDDSGRRRIDENERVFAANAAIKPDPSGKSGPTADELLEVETTNAYRAMLGRSALHFDMRLWKAARLHCEWMTRTGKFEHEEEPKSDTASPDLRARRCGYDGGATENIAYGAGTGRMNGVDAHWDWCTSAGHHRNLLRAGHKDIGTASVGIFWTMMLGGDPLERGGR